MPLTPPASPSRDLWRALPAEVRWIAIGIGLAVAGGAYLGRRIDAAVEPVASDVRVIRDKVQGMDLRLTTVEDRVRETGSP